MESLLLIAMPKEVMRSTFTARHHFVTVVMTKRFRSFKVWMNSSSKLLSAGWFSMVNTFSKSFFRFCAIAKCFLYSLKFDWTVLTRTIKKCLYCSRRENIMMYSTVCTYVLEQLDTTSMTNLFRLSVKTLGSVWWSLLLNKPLRQTSSDALLVLLGHVFCTSPKYSRLSIDLLIFFNVFFTTIYDYITTLKIIGTTHVRESSWNESKF